MPAALSRGGVLSAALCIGAMVPDLPYFLPFRLGNPLSHQPLGLVTYDLLMGVIAVMLWVRWLARPVYAIAPTWWRRRVAPPTGVWSWKMLGPAVSGVLIGAGTHLLWDAFTHPWGFLVAAIPAVVAYNKFTNDLSRYSTRLEGFADEFSAILSRQLDERAR